MADKAWELVLDRIERDLRSGAVRIGERLPAERALAADLAVGRSSVREALRVLEASGVVRTSTGSGPQAGATVIARPDGGLASVMRLQVAGRGFHVAHVVRTRVLLETEVVGDLARRGVPTDDARALLAEMDAAEDADTFLALDARFHAALADASGNGVIAAVMAGLRGSIEQYVREGAASVADWPAEAALLQSEHRAVVAAVRAGDAAAAVAAVATHIEGYYARTDLLAVSDFGSASPTR